MERKIVTLDNLEYFYEKLKDTLNDNADIIDVLNQSISNKQDTIADLETIRQGAAKGATALQSVPSEYVTETELSNKGYATISALNNKVDAINGKKDKPNVQNVTTASVSLVLTPNTIYNCTSALSDIAVTSFNTTSEGHEEYMVLFKSGNATTISLPSDVCWANGEHPEIDADTEYELSISKRVVDGANIFKAILVPFKTIE